MDILRHFLPNRFFETNVILNCMDDVTVLFVMRSPLKRKELAPGGANYFLSELTQNSGVASLAVYPLFISGIRQ